MDFHGSSVFISPREDTATAEELCWPAWSRTVDDDGEHESPLGPVRSYADAESLVRTASAERLFVPAEVLADMVRAGVGPT